MKIFNWVQRRFNHPIIKDGLARNIKKTNGIVIDTNTKALLEQVAMVDVLDGSILTIGTFGFDPLKPSSGEQKDYLALEREDEEGEEQYSDGDSYDVEYDSSNEEVNPLMFSSFDHSLQDVESDVTTTVNGAAEGITDHGTYKYELDAIEPNSKLRRRTTLADLFSEDSDSDSAMKKKPSSLELDSNSGKKETVRTKHGLSFAKKLIPQVGEDSRPIKMINHMMRRMMKRKIHPELEGSKGNKLSGQYSTNHDAGESVYLLQCPPGSPTA